MFATQDFILNRGGGNVEGRGPVAELLANHSCNPGLFRPYFGDDNHAYVDVRNAAGVYEAARIKDLRDAGVQLPNVCNATSLRKEQWIEVDDRVKKAARYRLRAWADLAANSTHRLNGMSKTVLEYETMSDEGEAIQDMDVLSEDRDFDPKFQLEGIPLPITHAGFRLGARRLAISRSGPGEGLDTIKIEMAGRRVAELVEAQTIGTRNGMAYGGTGPYGTSGFTYSRTSAIYGYTNFPLRNTKTNLTAPTGSNPEVTVSEVLGMIQTMRNLNFSGPYMLYHSNAWDQYLDNDYARLGGNNASITLRERLRKIEGIMDVRRLDLLFGSQVSAASVGASFPTEVDNTLNQYTLVLVQMTPDVARAVDGLSLTTIQWEEKGGQELRFRVMSIWVPQIFADYYGRCGVLHATTS